MDLLDVLLAHRRGHQRRQRRPRADGRDDHLAGSEAGHAVVLPERPRDRQDLAGLEAQRALAQRGGQDRVQPAPGADVRLPEVERVDGQHRMPGVELPEDLGRSPGPAAVGHHDGQHVAAIGTGHVDPRPRHGPGLADPDLGRAPPVLAPGLLLQILVRRPIGIRPDDPPELPTALPLPLGVGRQTFVYGEHGLPRRPRGQLQGQRPEIEVPLGQGDAQGRGRPDLRVVDRLRVVVPAAVDLPMRRQEFVERPAVVELVIVVARVLVDVCFEVILGVEEGEGGAGGVEQRRQGVVGPEAALVLGVEGEQGRPGGHHRGEMRVIDDRGQVRGGLLAVAEVVREAGPGPERRVAGDGVGQGDAGVQGAEEDRLPAAAGEPGDGHAAGVGVGVIEQNIEGILQG